jgi:hypothetical protein
MESPPAAVEGLQGMGLAAPVHFFTPARSPAGAADHQ